MTRILCWNIQTFGINKLGMNAWDTNGSRRQHILSTVAETDALAGGLDVLIVIEVQTTAGFGGLIGGASGPAGSLALLADLQAANAAAGWSLVPPLVTTTAGGGGYSEGVAVFFKSTTLNFIGPMMWTGMNGAIPGAGPPAAVAYAAPWNLALPGAASMRPGGGFTQNQLAGKVDFFDAANAFIYFPDPGRRSLWMTQFLNPANGRYLSLFAVHFPPDVRAQNAFRNLVAVPEIVGAPVFGGPEDRVVIGDFNINSLNPFSAAVFAHLNGNHAVGPNSPLAYATAFGPAVPEPTSIQPVDTASTVGLAPFYNYGSTTIGGLHAGWDNIFVHRSGAPAPAAPQVSVVNRIVGTPVGYNVDMATDIPTINNPIPNPPNPNYLPPGAPRSQHFRTLVNYGHIGGTWGASDHLAVCVELP